MLVDHRSEFGDFLRKPLSYPADTIRYVAHMPAALAGGVKEYASSASELRDENRRLARQSLILEQKAQRLAVLEAENVRLRELLNSSARIDARVRVAEIIGLEADPNRHEVLVNLAESEGVQKGQAVLDAHGLVGQVVQVGAMASRVILITDATHALSVQVNRTGVRSILAGTGHPNRMNLLYLPQTSDVKEGDLLVTTGLGQRFPAGYPVAKVVKVVNDPTQPFMQVVANPVAMLDRISHVLVVSDQQLQQSDAADEEGGSDG